MQDLVRCGIVQLTKIAGDSNPADIFTKFVKLDVLRRHLQRAGLVINRDQHIFQVCTSWPKPNYNFMKDTSTSRSTKCSSTSSTLLIGCIHVSTVFSLSEQFDVHLSSSRNIHSQCNSVAFKRQGNLSIQPCEERLQTMCAVRFSSEVNPVEWVKHFFNDVSFNIEEHLDNQTVFSSAFHQEVLQWPRTLLKDQCIPLKALQFHVGPTYMILLKDEYYRFMHQQGWDFRNRKDYMFLNFHFNPQEAFTMRAYLENSRHNLQGSQEYILLQWYFHRHTVVNNVFEVNPKSSMFMRKGMQDASIALHSGGLHTFGQHELSSHRVFLVKLPERFKSLGDTRSQLLGHKVFNHFHLLFSFGKDIYKTPSNEAIIQLATYYEYTLFFLSLIHI